MAPGIRSLAAYLPMADARCPHPSLSSSVSDKGIELGEGAALVSVPVSGQQPVVKVMCRACGRTGGALPRNARVDGEATDVTQLPDRDTIKPEPPPRPTGIPTTYAGTNFRSRLEARWAAFFDLVGWSWVYEPLDADGYIPDFLITGAAPFLVEVGPCITGAEYKAKASKPLTVLDHATLVVGAAAVLPDPFDGHRAGLMVNEFHQGSCGPAFWYRCESCGGISVYGDDVHRPCGHAAGFGRVTIEVQNRFASAGNQVQWGRGA